VIETPRLTLRQFSAEDDGHAAFIEELVNDADFLRFIGDRNVKNRDDARRYIRDGPAASYARHGFGLLHVSRREDGTPVGMCGLLQRPWLHEPDIGFAFLKPFRAQGYGRESAAAVLTWARREIGATRIAAIVTPDNVPSLALLARLGFRRERTVRPPGEDTDLELLVADV
jgi:RimJ/RimL family protein N-acetyltransferase